MKPEVDTGLMSTDSERIRNRIIDTFVQSGDSFVSGGMLAQSLEVTRTAVWKHIRALEEMGFRFESIHGTGYRLLESPDLVLEPLLASLLEPKASLGRYVRWFSEVDSTNSHAMQLALQKAPHGTIVTALRQTGGHGRRGKTWFSPEGGLWLSIVLQRPFPLRHAPELTLLASVALRRAVLSVAGVTPRIKWPNDLLIDGKKVSGILAEIRADGEYVEHAVVGIGLNTNIPDEAFPDELKPRSTSILKCRRERVSQLKLTARLLTEFEDLFDSLLNGQGFALVSEEWRHASSTLGTHIRVQTPSGLVEGQAERIDDQGVLFVRLSTGEIAQIHSGEVLFD